MDFVWKLPRINSPIKINRIIEMSKPDKMKQDKKASSTKRLNLLGQVMEELAIEENDPLLMKQAQQLKNKKD
jgi:hypothetical protein